MLKNILNFKGAQELSKNEQKSISGGVNMIPKCSTDAQCVLWTNGARQCCKQSTGQCVTDVRYCD